MTVKLMYKNSLAQCFRKKDELSINSSNLNYVAGNHNIIELVVILAITSSNILANQDSFVQGQTAFVLTFSNADLRIHHIQALKYAHQAVYDFK